MSRVAEPAGAQRPDQEQMQLLAVRKAHHGACREVEPGADSKVLDHASDGDLTGGRLGHRRGRDVRGRAEPG
jgi:hypothetical protein